MAITHAASGELIDVRPLGAGLRQAVSRTLVRQEHFEVLRMVLHTGKATVEHTAAGAITIQCLEGAVELEARGRTEILTPGLMVYLANGEPHAVKALQDSSLLISILLKRE